MSEIVKFQETKDIVTYVKYLLKRYKSVNFTNYINRNCCLSIDLVISKLIIIIIGKMFPQNYFFLCIFSVKLTF